MGCNNSKNKIKDFRIETSSLGSENKIPENNITIPVKENSNEKKIHRSTKIFDFKDSKEFKYNTSLKSLESLILEFENWVDSYISDELDDLISKSSYKFDMNIYITIKSFEIRIEKKLDLCHFLNVKIYLDINDRYNSSLTKLINFLNELHVKNLSSNIYICPKVYDILRRYIRQVENIVKLREN